MVGCRDVWNGGQIGDLDQVLLKPFAIGLLGSNGSLEFVIAHNPALFHVDQEHLARLKATLENHIFVLDLRQNTDL